MSAGRRVAEGDARVAEVEGRSAAGLPPLRRAWLAVTKLDGTGRGGAIVGIWRELKLPIYFLGLGEQPEDLQPFSAENYAKAVFGAE